MVDVLPFLARLREHLALTVGSILRPSRVQARRHPLGEVYEVGIALVDMASLHACCTEKPGLRMTLKK